MNRSSCRPSSSALKTGSCCGSWTRRLAGCCVTARSSQKGWTMTHEVVFLFDVDNTLLDNDRVTADLKRHLENKVGPERQARYWTIFEQLRGELGYADYLGALQRYRVENPRDPNLLTVSEFLVNYPFSKRLFARALDVVERVTQWGPAVILSDGDVVFH